MGTILASETNLAEYRDAFRTPPGLEYNGGSQLASDVRMTSVSLLAPAPEGVCLSAALCTSSLSHNKATPLQQSHPIISNDRQEGPFTEAISFIFQISVSLRDLLV